MESSLHPASVPRGRDGAPAPWRRDVTWTSLDIEMPVSAPQMESHLAETTSSPSLATLAAALERVSGDIASAARDPESLHDLRGAIRHLEVVGDNLAQAAAAMAFAATDDPAGGRFATPGPTAKAVAWRLHHLSHAYRASRELCAVVARAAEALEDTSSYQAEGEGPRLCSV